MRSITLFGTTVATNTTTDTAIPASPTFRTSSCKKARGDMCIIGINGNIQVALGIQTSNDTQTWTDHTSTMVLSYTAANGWVHAGSFGDLSSFTDGKQYFRFVWYVKLSSGTTLATAYVYGNADAVPMS